MKDTLIKLFSDYQKTQDEYNKQFMYLDDISPNWDGERLALYSSFGIVVGKYLEQHEETLRAIDFPISEQEVKQIISVNYKNNIKELSLLDKSNTMNNYHLKNFKDALSDLESLNLRDWIKKHHSFILNQTKIPIYYSIGLIYIYYSYEEYKRNKNSIYNSNQDNILKLYNNVIREIPSLSKYGLLPIDTYRNLICIEPPRIYDNSINKTFFLNNVSFSLANKFKELINNKLIGEISFRVSNDNIIDGQNYVQTLLEDVERGEIFSLSNINSYDVTKLYSANFQDCLWVIIDNNNITFEELCDDFDVYEDMIITQVIHLQYTQANTDMIITHLDHEYIFYNEDEYEARLNNPYQKGSAACRIKSFKIDKSCIPFTTPCIVQYKDSNGDDTYSFEIPFIYFILDSFFKHKNLLQEYFQKILV
ncbi:TPA: hypothetical protein I9Z92_003050 [Clostridium perfringens]|uniref:hypothetical protein n=2 Tax=Clostridium perfringens TaxID=1502 RepID=UPI001A1F102C|nr:hypothetical protein [Clostridium perfringens]MEA5269141.1 hypothetical protein [Clostridium perfringens]HAT4236190.1 hypothetical protein [Clostridium perfringens]HAT4239261.1 hypothetical protein [Clostridium perfringens]